MNKQWISTVLFAVIFCWVSLTLADSNTDTHAMLNYELDTQWGPDGWGYSAKDPVSGGESYNWIDITSSGTEVWEGEWVEEEWSNWIQLPFTFPFYDGSFDSLSFSTELIIRFLAEEAWSYYIFPSNYFTYMIAPWNYEMYHDYSSHFYYQAFSDSMFVVSFHDAEYYDDRTQSRQEESKTLQILLFSDGRIKFQYHELNTIWPGTPDNSGIDDNYGPYGLSIGHSFYDSLAITIYPPEPGIILAVPMVTPSIGTPSDSYYYSVIYRNTEGVAPTVREIHINTNTYTMTDPGGDYAAGVTMTYGPVTLPLGNHTYWFYFSDGTYSARSPEFGEHTGPFVSNALSGEYDIGGGNNDLASPVDAAAALQYLGVGGPVLFNIFTGVYEGQVELPGTIPGMGASNPIVFRNEPGESPVITIDEEGAGFYLTGADYVTIQGLEFHNCDQVGIHNYRDGADSSTHNHFIGNYIHGDMYVGIRLEYGQDCEVSGNEIDSCSIGVLVLNSNNNLISNNMITNSQHAGIMLENNSDNNEIYYNSVYTNRGQSAFEAYAYGSNTLKNNILANEGPGGFPGTYAIYWDRGTLVSDYNDLYITDGYIGKYSGGYYTTLADWQTATGGDANSISAYPVFLDNTISLHINTTLPSPVDSAGTPIAGITTDFDGETRDATYPDIGADEFDYVPLQYYIALSPENQEEIGMEGDDVDYMFTVDNHGTMNDVYNLAVNVTGETWSHTLYDATGMTVIDSLSVNAFSSDSFLVRVSIPFTATPGQFSSSELTVVSRYGSTDNILSDTSNTTTNVCMHGTLDIGGGNNDFPSPDSAAAVMEALGVCGPVIFNIFSGVYDGEIYLSGNVPGMGAANPITFQNAPGESPVITSSHGRGFYLDGADYVTIQGLEIYNCYYDGIYNDNLDSDLSTHNSFIGNYIHFADWSGHEGIDFNRGADCEVIGNELDSCGYSIHVWDSDRILVANNMITNSNDVGLYSGASSDIEFYYNSVYMDQRGLAFQLSSGGPVTLKNNILVNEGPSGQPGSYALFWYEGTLVSDYNDLYSPYGFVGHYYGTNYTNLAAWQTTSQDSHSISADPNFVDNLSDLHIDTSVPSPVDSAGIPIAGITTDFDGDTRDATFPDIGADEFAVGGSLEPVEDLVITMPSMQDASLHWSPVSGAVQYHVYKSTTSPDSGFTLVSSTPDTFYVDTSAITNDTRSFYYIIVDDQ